MQLVKIIIVYVAENRFCFLMLSWIGAWLGFATPILILVWILPTLIMYKITKKLDFDKALEKNAVDWFPKLERENSDRS